MKRVLGALCLVLSAIPAAAQQPEALSLLDDLLYPPSFPRDERARLESDLASTREAYTKDRTNADAALGYIRAQIALGHVGDALETIAHAIEVKPDDDRLVLERARALIIHRKFDSAERDARKALETIPEASCTLGLALYLKMQFPQAREAYGKCVNPGVFKYLADRRSGGSGVARPDLSAATSEAPVTEIKLPGSVSSRPERPDQTMVAAYVAAAETIAAEKKPPARGKKDPAEDALRKIVEKESNRWLEPIYIAAEADYARILKAEGKLKKPGARKKKRT
ncbi:MAG TPA: tetratricopeptide repeat protein [Vicinamibacterales bacterium]